MVKKIKIICTIGKLEEAKLKETIKRFIDAGMDIARINMAHYDLRKQADAQYLTKLIDTIRNVAKTLNRTVAIMGDIQGPKVRIKEFLGSLRNRDRVELKKGDKLIITSSSQLPVEKMGASLKYEGNFNFVDDVKKSVKNPDKPIEFWLADGAVILETRADDIEDTNIPCTVKVAGEIKAGQGVSVKNTTIRPGEYELWEYTKDAEDIEFLLENGIDFFALSFVKSRDDVLNLQRYIKGEIKEKNLQRVEQRFYGMKDFPIIPKIETEDAVKRIDEIIDVSYGIMVARGDLALQTGIQDVPITQKQIIERCIVRRKPVITATQMLLSMMNFIEPRRSEACDVANAIFDGSDTLMLSEETADPDSKFPVESVEMMAGIAIKTEAEIEKKNKLEYKYKVDQVHEKISKELAADQYMIKQEKEQGKITDLEYKDRTLIFQRLEHAEHISYNACKISFELGCKAIIALTDTGATARTISRFKPDGHIIAGVYDDQIARILQLSYNVKAVKIERNNREYPFEEFHQVIQKAKNLGLIQTGDRVITVAGYPRRAPGTVTFLNISTVL